MILSLVPDKLSATTIKATEELREAARKGELVGIAVIARYKGGDWTWRATGWCTRNPHFARGLLQTLNDHLGKLVESDQ